MIDAYLRPRVILDGFSRLYPDTWIQVDDVRDMRRKLGDWPDWCFLPMKCVYAIVSDETRIKPADQSKQAILLSALAPWRATQGIYRFDPSTFDAIWKTPVTGDIPTEVLRHLPEWCVYIPTPEQTWRRAPLYGFFAHLEHSTQLGRTELRLVLDISATPGEQLAMIPIRLGIGGVAEALEALFKETARSTRVTVDARERDLEMLKRDMPPLVSLVLYLCCQSAEITDQHGANRLPARPQPVKTKRGLRFFPPDRPTRWQVGYRLGAALRRAASERGASSSSGTHASPRPHIRRAHWHSFWVGKWGQPEVREVVLKWLPPIPVNVHNVEELTTTVRGVRDERRPL
jgi:hypothetical protein